MVLQNLDVIVAYENSHLAPICSILSRVIVEFLQTPNVFTKNYPPYRLHTLWLSKTRAQKGSRTLVFASHLFDVRFSLATNAD